MIVFKRNVDQSNLKVGCVNFEKVDNFKYLGVKINSSNNMHREIKERISNRNKCYFSHKQVIEIKTAIKKVKNYFVHKLP